MILLDKTFISLTQTRDLFELLKLGGVIFIGKYAIKLIRTDKYYTVELYIHGRDYTDKVLINMGKYEEIKKLKEIKKQEKNKIETSLSTDEVVELF